MVARLKDLFDMRPIGIEGIFYQQGFQLRVRLFQVGNYGFPPKMCRMRKDQAAI